MTQWKYYNHALIPDQPPHLPVDVSEIESGRLFSNHAQGRVLFARWTEGWDLPQETHFWYCIKDTKFEYERLPKKARYEVRKGKKNFTVTRIDPIIHKEDIYRIHQASSLGYAVAFRPVITRENVYRECQSIRKGIIYGAFDETNCLQGYAALFDKKSYLALSSLKTNPAAERKGVNAALMTQILEDFNDVISPAYYICDGARNVQHQTAFQDYLEKYFGFRKAYCKLCVKYRPGIHFIIKIVYPFHNLLQRLVHIRSISRIKQIHQFNSVLNMEGMCRADAQVEVAK